MNDKNNLKKNLEPGKQHYKELTSETQIGWH